MSSFSRRPVLFALLAAVIGAVAASASGCGTLRCNNRSPRFPRLSIDDPGPDTCFHFSEAVVALPGHGSAAAIATSDILSLEGPQTVFPVYLLLDALDARSRDWLAALPGRYAVLSGVGHLLPEGFRLRTVCTMRPMDLNLGQSLRMLLPLPRPDNDEGNRTTPVQPNPGVQRTRFARR